MNLLSTAKYAAIVVIVTALQSCSDQQAFLKGKSLLEQGNTKEGFNQLQLAVNQQPSNLEFKSYYYRQREAYSAKLLREADTARINFQWDEAQTKYNRILEFDSQNERAIDGIRAIDSGKINQNKLAEANKLFNSNDLENAKDKVRSILSEDPTNSQARILLSSIERKKAAEKTPAYLIHSKFMKTVSLEFKDANIKTVFELLSKSAGINFILDKEIPSDARVNIFVTHTSIEDALQNILSTSQLSKKILNEKSVLIYPNSKKPDFEEMIVRTFYINNVDPKQMQSLIRTVVKTKDIFVDDQTNILVMRDSPEAIRVAEKLVNAYDVSDPEVVLEMEVLEISKSKLNEIGVKWPNQVAVGVKGAAGNGQLSFDEAQHFNGSFGTISITNPALVLNLSGTDTSTNILANPNVRVKNHKKATVHIGQRVPVITSTSTATGFVAETVSYLDVGLKLNVIPTIYTNDEVSIDIGLEVSSIINQVTSKNGTLTYTLGTRDANTTLRLKNGETQILAGLINDNESTSADRVPGVANIPIIGRLFSSKRDSRDKTELVLLVTPRIVRNIIPPEAAYAEFSSGTDSGNSTAVMTSDNTGQLPLQPAVLDTNPAEVSSQTKVNDGPVEGESMPEPLNIPPPPTLPIQPNIETPAP